MANNIKIGVAIGMLGTAFLCFYFLAPDYPQGSATRHHARETRETGTAQEEAGATRITTTTTFGLQEEIEPVEESAAFEQNTLSDYQTRLQYADTLHKKFVKMINKRRRNRKNIAEDQRRKSFQLVELTLHNVGQLMDAIESEEYGVNDAMPNPSRRILDMLILRGHFRQAAELIQQGALLDDDESDPPYHIAPMIAMLGTLEHIRFIDEHGADLNARNIFERNSFVNAVSYGKLEIARYLEKRGVDLNPCPPGETALDLALNANPRITPELIEYLFSLGFVPCEEHLEIISKDCPYYNEIYNLVRDKLREAL